MMFLRVSMGVMVALCLGTARCAWEEDTVVPVLLDRTREPEPWRTLSPEEREKEAEMREYRLDVFGTELLLQLEPDQTFLAPGFVFQIVGTEPTPEPRTEACFYSGTVNGEAHSAAALNLCQGLRGGFYYQGHEYFIQPLNSSDLQQDLHIIRRRGRAAQAEEGSSKCGVNEDEERVPRNLEKEARQAGDGAQQTGTGWRQCVRNLGTDQ